MRGPFVDTYPICSFDLINAIKCFTDSYPLLANLWVRLDSNKYTQHTIFNILKKIILNYPKSAAMGFFSKGLENEFETAMVIEPPVFKPLKFYCILKSIRTEDH